MSVLAFHGRTEAGVVIKKGGPVSTALWEKKVGDKFWVRGPYGHPFSVGHHHKLLVVGGGTGLVPLISFLVHLRGRDVTLITGARTSSELLFKDWLLSESKDHHFKLVFATDDGTYGEKNQVPKVVEHVLKEGSFDAVYTCGPERKNPTRPLRQECPSRGRALSISLSQVDDLGKGSDNLSEYTPF